MLTLAKILLMVFVHLSKAFDRVWRKGCFYKLKCTGINGPFLSFLKSFLTDRQQRVVLNGHSMNWKNLKVVYHKDWF